MIELTKRIAFSDWLFLYYFAKNIQGYVFRDFFLDLARDMEGKKPVSENEQELLQL